MRDRDRRALMLGLGVTVFGILAFRAAPWAIRSLRTLEDRVTAESELLSRARREMASRPTLIDSIDNLQSVIEAFGPFMLSGPDVPTAIRDLLARATVAVSRHNVTVQQVELVDDSVSVADVTRVSVRVLLETDLRGMMDVLGDLERDTAMTVSSLDVRRREGLGEEDPEVLDVVVVVGGWVLARKNAEIEVGKATSELESGS